MRKLLLLLVLTLLFCGAIISPVYSFESASAFGYGYVTQKGADSEPGYYIGIDIPIVEKADARFLFKNETTYLYANRGETELQIIRTLMIGQKSLWTKTQVLADETTETYFEWYVGLGSGTWTFLATGAENDEMYGVFNARTGMNYRGVFVMISADIVQVPGHDLFAPFFGIGFDF